MVKQVSRFDDENARFFRKVYGWMFLGLLITALSAYVVASIPTLSALILETPLVFVLIIVELVLVISLAGFVKRISPSLAILFFLLYSFVTGLTFSSIFIVYTSGSIALVFIITAVMFGVMSLYGIITKADLTKLGHIMIMGLIGLIICSLINLFIGSSSFDFAISIIGVIIFTGLTAYDVQKIKKLNILGNEGSGEDQKEAIIGALTLYLDFINLFLSLLRIFGKRK